MSLEAWSFVVNVATLLSTLVLSSIAVAAAVIAIRRPKLELMTVTLAPPQAAPFMGEIERQQKSYPGPPPDCVLIVTLRNAGKVSALRVSGSLHIFSGIEPLNYPGYPDTRIQFAAMAGVFAVTVPPADEHRAPPEPTYARLSLLIPARLLLTAEEEKSDAGVGERLSGKSIHIMYRFVAENGVPVEGEGVLECGEATNPVNFCVFHPVPDDERGGASETAARRVIGLLGRLKRRLGGRN